MSILLNAYVLLFAAIFLGSIFSKVRIKGFAIGSAGVLFAGIAIGYVSLTLAGRITPDSSLYAQAQELIQNEIIPNQMTDIFMMIFICSVGLIAGKDLLGVMKKYGVKFILLALVITLVGAAGTYGFTCLSKNHSTYEVSGVYTGALTSTSGLAVALETAAGHSWEEIRDFDIQSERKKEEIVFAVGQPSAAGFTQKQMDDYVKYACSGIGVGHTIGYPFGVIVVLLGVNLLPGILRIDLRKEKEEYEREFTLEGRNQDAGEKGSLVFNFVAFFLVMLVGYMLGMVPFPLPLIGKVNLGSTGGILIAALCFGAKRRLGGISFLMDVDFLNVLKDIGVAMTLSSVGLRYGHAVIEALLGSGWYLGAISIVIGLVALLVGCVIGRYCLHINWFLLSGAICGGMTSTPGLSAAIDSTGSNVPAVGYGATYPFATIFMVIFTIVLRGLPV